MASGPIISWQIDGKLETVADFIFLAPKSPWMVTAATELKMLAPWKQRYDKPKQHFIIIFFFFTLQYCIGFAIHQHAILSISYRNSNLKRNWRNLYKVKNYFF